MIMYLCMKRMRTFSIANMMTSDWGRFKGPPSASEWTFGRGKVTQCKTNFVRGRVATCRRCPWGELSHGHTACEPAGGGVG